MPYDQLIFETSCGASGDMLLAAMLDLLPVKDEFVSCLENIGLNVKIRCLDKEKNHLRAKQVVVESAPNPIIRRFCDIEAFIAKSHFSEPIKGHALKIFERIFSAEAEVHGEKFEEVHLHELGADDSLVDILGFCFLWEKLGYPEILFTTLITGQGHIQTRHGLLPVPPPAVLKLIEGFRFRSGKIETELLTPTGAAILTTLGRQIDGDTSVTPVKTGVGCGQRSFKEIPNILRAILAQSPIRSEGAPVRVMECFIDDMTGETLAYLGEKLKASGAIDFFFAPGLMKKCRSGHHLMVICEEEAYPQVAETLFRESATIGCRVRREDRLVLERRESTIIIDSIHVRFKIASWKGKECNRKPEFQDVSLLAEKKGISIKEAYRLAIRKIHEDDEPG